MDLTIENFIEMLASAKANIDKCEAKVSLQTILDEFSLFIANCENVNDPMPSNITETINKLGAIGNNGQGSDVNHNDHSGHFGHTIDEKVIDIMKVCVRAVRGKPLEVMVEELRKIIISHLDYPVQIKDVAINALLYMEDIIDKDMSQSLDECPCCEQGIRFLHKMADKGSNIILLCEECGSTYDDPNNINWGNSVSDEALEAKYGAPEEVLFGPGFDYATSAEVMASGWARVAHAGLACIRESYLEDYFHVCPWCEGSYRYLFRLSNEKGTIILLCPECNVAWDDPKNIRGSGISGETIENRHGVSNVWPVHWAGEEEAKASPWADLLEEGFVCLNTDANVENENDEK